MKRFATNAGFALIFIVVGAIASGLFCLLIFKLFAFGYHVINIRVLDGVDYSIVEQLQFATFFVAWAGFTLWLFYKKRKIDYRWSSKKYLRCLRCGYDLRGNQSDTCPECGQKMTSIQQDALSINHA